MDASGMAYDASGNTSSSSFTLRFNGTTIEQGQNVLLSYANTDSANTFSGITDLAGNELASFAFQLENFSRSFRVGRQSWQAHYRLDR